MEKKGKKDFRWRYQIAADSDMGRLFDYIQNQDLHPTIAKNEMILQALWTYYMPSVYSADKRSPEEQKRKAYESIFALQSQIEKIIFEFDLEIERVPINNLKRRKNQEELYGLDNDNLAEKDGSNRNTSINKFTYSV